MPQRGCVPLGIAGPPPDGSSAREGRKVWSCLGGKCLCGWEVQGLEGDQLCLRRKSPGTKGLHLFQLDSGCAGGKKGHRALSQKSSSLSKVQAEDALKCRGEEMAVELDTWRGPSRSPAEGGITAGPGCNSAESFVPAKKFLGNKLFSTARKGERTQGRGSADGASGIWEAEASRRENNSSRERI